MAKMTTHRPRRRKQAIARGLINHPTLTEEEKTLALYLLRFADDEGVIKNPELNALIEEVERDVRNGSLNGSF